jgi:prophage regulatory protein
MSQPRWSLDKVRAVRQRLLPPPDSRPASEAEVGRADVNSSRPIHSHESKVERLEAVPLRFIRFTAVRDRTGLSRSTIWRLERRGAFPKHKRLSTNAVGWLEQEIDQWVRSRSTIG